MIEVNKCFGTGFGWICALNRWSVQERVQTSFCPLARQVLHCLAWELCMQIAAWILSRLTPYLLMCGVRRGVWGGGPFGLEAQNWHVTVMELFSVQSGGCKSCLNNIARCFMKFEAKWTTPVVWAEIQFKFWHWMFTYWATTLYPGPLFISEHDKITSYDQESFNMLKTDLVELGFLLLIFSREIGQNGVPDQLLLRFAPFLLQWYSLLKCGLLI